MLPTRFRGLSRVARYEVGDAASGVVTKRADYVYRPDGAVASVTRYAGAGVNPVATTVSTFDGLGRTVGITHTPAAAAAIGYAYAYDAADRVVSQTTPEGLSSFKLDAADQLLSASLTGEAYAYDATGNRTGGGVVTAAGNRMVFDGVYRYAYDAEGNRTARFRDVDGSGTLTAGDSDVTAYGWDQRNRLVGVSHVAAWTATQAGAVAGFQATGTGLPGSDLELRYTYDFADRRIRRSLDADGVAGAGQESVSYAAYAGEDRTLEIARGGIVISDGVGRVVGFVGGVVQRNCYGSGEDEILAVDRVAGGTTSTFWTLGDRQGTVRDIVSGNAADRGKVVEHRQYDSYGKLVRRTASPVAGSPVTAGVGIDFGYAGRPQEDRTGLSDNRARWYEPGTGRFLNEDPSGFKGGDANLFRYVGNDPLDRIDPSGLMAKWAQPASRASGPAVGWAGVTTTSGITPPQPSTAVTMPTAMPTYSLTSPTASAPRTAAAPSRPALVSQPYASLVTTGRAAPAAPLQRMATESTRWTANDREAKLASIAAYDVHDGGLLRKIGIYYGQGSPYGRDGFSAHLTYSEKTKTYYLAFRGTEDSVDVWADIFQGVGLRSSQHEQAVRLAEEVKAKLGNVRLELTGHSLGGSLAAAAAYATKLNAITFNPASVSPSYRTTDPVNIRSHVIFGEFLTVGRTISNGLPDPGFPNPNVRFAPGEIIVHPPRSANILDYHSLYHFPD